MQVMSYLSDSITLIGITDYKYSFFLGEDLVLIRFDKVASRTYKTAITKMSVLSNISSLYRRLYDGVVLGASYGCISYYNGGNNKTIFYDDSDDIPDKLSNINYYPLGQIVELDSLSLEFLLSRGRAKTKK